MGRARKEVSRLKLKRAEIKVLFVITQSELGGAQRYVLELASNLPERYEAVIAAGKDGDGAFIESAKAAGIRTIQLKLLKRNISPLHDYFAVGELHRLLKEEAPDIVHLNSSKASIIGGLAVGSSYCSVYTVHGWVFLELISPVKQRIFASMERYASNFHDGIIVLSENDFEAGRRSDIDTSKFIKIQSGVNSNSFLPRDEARNKIEEIAGTSFGNRKLILATSNFYPPKGINVLIDAMTGIKNDALAVVFGDGALRASLEKQISRLKLTETVLLPGFVKNASSYLKGADIFALPSVKEGLPYALLDAINARVPIVATAVGGVAEVLDRVVVEPNNPGALAAGLKTQLQSPVLPASPPPSFDRMLESTLECYEKILEKGRAKPPNGS